MSITNGEDVPRRKTSQMSVKYLTKNNIIKTKSYEGGNCNGLSFFQNDIHVTCFLAI